MLAFCGIVAGNLLCWTHTLPGNFSSGNIQKGQLLYMPVVHVSCPGNLFADCQSIHQGYEAQNPGPGSSPGSGLPTGKVCLRKDTESVWFCLWSSKTQLLFERMLENSRAKLISWYEQT